MSLIGENSYLRIKWIGVDLYGALNLYYLGSNSRPVFFFLVPKIVSQFSIASVKFMGVASK